MEENTWKITLADGTAIEDLKLNGNNFISSKKLTEASFAGGLTEVTYECSDGSAETHHDMELVQITHPATKEWWFVLRELSEAELSAIKTQSQIEYIAMMSDIDLEEG